MNVKGMDAASKTDELLEKLVGWLASWLIGLIGWPAGWLVGLVD